ncbi:hypothetical protein RJT34_11796 [Clitoria ternatea]|uniref:Uncharacterized protein n=1 Tax=Clitoria ternatea TaxID=43366 RepID=A0AAN9JN97_CLITE
MAWSQCRVNVECYWQLMVDKVIRNQILCFVGLKYSIAFDFDTVANVKQQHKVNVVGKFGNRPRDFTYDVSKADEIHDFLEKVGLDGSPEHQVQLDALKGQKPVCKFHASNSHATADYVAFRHAIQDKIDGGLLSSRNWT